MSETPTGYQTHTEGQQGASAPTVDVVALRAAAEAATPGPWTTYPRMGIEQDDDWGGWDIEGPPEPSARGQFARMADAKYIAAFHPATALALLDRLAALEAALEELREGLGVSMSAVDARVVIDAALGREEASRE